MTGTVDQFVIGGGINSAGIARDTAERGLSEILCEKDDLAQGTSSRSGSRRNVRLVKGSHVVVPKFWDGPQAYLVQNTDKRVIFINPHEGDRAQIGTTDVLYDGAPEQVTVDDSEIADLIDVVNRFIADLRRAHPWLPEDLADHYARLYGTRSERVIGEARDLSGLGRRFGPRLYEAEARYLLAHEWAETEEDLLWRRTKHRLRMSETEQAAFADWLAADTRARSA